MISINFLRGVGSVLEIWPPSIQRRPLEQRHLTPTQDQDALARDGQTIVDDMHAVLKEIINY